MKVWSPETTSIMEDLSQPISTTNPSIVLNGTIYNLNSFTADQGEAKNEFACDKYEGVTSANLLSDNGVLVDPSRRLILTVTGDTGASNNGSVGLSTINGSIDLQIPGNLLTTADLTSDVSGSSFVTVQPDQATGQTLLPTAALSQSITAPLQLPVYTAETKPANDDSKKRKGGWPKGKKRKKDTPRAGPRAPASGYVLYAIVRRQQIKEMNPEMSFRDSTKILGSEWSAMSSQDKQKYLDEAAADQQRYIAELKEYQQSDAYQTWLRKKKQRMKDAHHKTDDPLEFLDNSAYSSIEEDGLYCRLCNLYFSSSHNKREHIYGKQHLNNVTEEFEKERLKQQTEGTSDSDLLNSDHDSVHPGSFNALRSDSEAGWSSSDESVCINSFMNRFLEKNQARDKELKYMRKTVSEGKTRNLELQETLRELKEAEERLSQELVTSHTINTSLSTQLDALKMVPSLFGVLITDDNQPLTHCHFS